MAYEHRPLKSIKDAVVGRVYVFTNPQYPEWVGSTIICTGTRGSLVLGNIVKPPSFPSQYYIPGKGVQHGQWDVSPVPTGVEALFEDMP